MGKLRIYQQQNYVPLKFEDSALLKHQKFSQSNHQGQNIIKMFSAFCWCNTLDPML